MNPHSFLIHFPIAFVAVCVLCGTLGLWRSFPISDACRQLARITGIAGAGCLLLIVVVVHPNAGDYSPAASVQAAIDKHQSQAFFSALGAACYLLLAGKLRKHQFSGDKGLVNRLEIAQAAISWFWLASLLPLVAQGMALSHDILGAR